VAEEADTIVLTISKSDFNRVVKKELAREVARIQEFLKQVNVFTMIDNQEDMHQIASYAEMREYVCNTTKDISHSCVFKTISNTSNTSNASPPFLCSLYSLSMNSLYSL